MVDCVYVYVCVCVCVYEKKNQARQEKWMKKTRIWNRMETHTHTHTHTQSDIELGHMSQSVADRNKTTKKKIGRPLEKT